MRALRNFTTAIQRLPTKLRRIVDFLHAARRPKLTFMLSLPDGRDVVNDEEDEDVWTADDGFLRAATRDAQASLLFSLNHRTFGPSSLKSRPRRERDPPLRDASFCEDDPEGACGRSRAGR